MAGVRAQQSGVDGAAGSEPRADALAQAGLGAHDRELRVGEGDAARALEEGGGAVGQGLVRPQPHAQLHVLVGRDPASVRGDGRHELGWGPS